MLMKEIRKKTVMKQILLLISILLFQTSSFANYNSPINSSTHFSFFEESQEQIELKIFPNPCKNKKVTVEVSDDFLLEIKVTNIAGKTVLLKKIEFPSNKEILELTDIPNGIYLVQVKTSNQKRFVKKLMISNQ